ncbi:MAG: YdbL family protein [Candidatus Kuenenia sp.]|nr:YdbL family protein [Candidatus Kuenenia hertensis]
MKSNIFATFLFILCAGIFLTNSTTFANDIYTIKGQMEKRLPIIVELKSKGIIGEDNKGYLQFMGTSREKEEVIDAENEDRKKVYASIAEKEGASTEQVGRRRALQIAKKALKGDWLQDQNGKWYQK